LDSANITQTLQDILTAAIHSHDRLQGSVARIERLAVHDGPGIRTVIFLKGCPLRCSWCASPETQHYAPELMFDRRRCIRCGACLPACPAAAVFRTDESELDIDRSLCQGCGFCIRLCLSGARRIVGTSFTVADIVGEIEKDEVFYYRSGGGVTISGGEPMAQRLFSAGILGACAERGIHTAMETSGHTAWEHLAPLLDRLDLIYVDIKHMDDAIHRRATGVGNQLILENIRKLMQTANRPAVIIRIPVIPGINDNEKNMQKTASFVCRLGGIERVELLPYHRYGLHSYKATGRCCELGDLLPPSDRRMRQLAKLFSLRRIPVQIGG
jgi:pyruvate formate lyase activating enzyme